MFSSTNIGKESANNQTTNKATFDKIYAKLAPVIYGMALRISKDESLAQAALIDVFLYLYKQGLLQPNSDMRPLTLFRTVFDCTASSLSGNMPYCEISKRINAEKKSLQKGATSRGG